jgi:hypothetical protein
MKCLVLLVLLLVHSWESSTEEIREDAEINNWVSNNYNEAINSLMPSLEIDDSRFWKDLRWTFAVRILPTFESDLECQFTLSMKSNNEPQIMLVFPIEGSIRKQLKLIKQSHRTSQLQEILQSMRIQQRQLTTKQLPALTSLASELESIDMSPLLTGELYNDPTTYEFWSGSRTREMRLWLNAPAYIDDAARHPLIKWAEKVRSSIQMYLQDTHKSFE